MRPRGSPAELERRRFRAVELLEKGEPREVVARILGVDPGTLSRWRRLAKAGNLKAKPAPGRPREMSVEDCKQLEALLSLGATAHGWANDLWTGKRVQQVIQRHFNVTYNPDYVCHILKVYLNWTSQLPEHHPRGDDPDHAEILRWTEEEFPRLLREADARGASLAFVDEAGFLLEPTARRTFAPRGRRPVQEISDKHGKISTIGAIIISPGRDSIDLAYHHLPDNENFDGTSVAAFVRSFHSALYGPMTIVWDQICIHRCRAVEEYLDEEPELVLESLPPYAPKLNPADGIWRHVKYHRLANYAPAELSALRETVTAELEGMKERPELLKSFVRFTKLPIIFTP
jgi:transposase